MSRPCRPGPFPAAGLRWLRPPSGWPASNRPAPTATPPATRGPRRPSRASLDRKPGNDQALAGRAALAAARHDFTDALAYADRALKANPYNERALCSRIDALVELGRYDDAARAADTADTRRPGVPVFTRYAYVRELRGEVDTARRVLEQALAGASAPADVAYVATSWAGSPGVGDHPAALDHYARALAADDTHLPALEGRARARPRAATGPVRSGIWRPSSRAPCCPARSSRSASCTRWGREGEGPRAVRPRRRLDGARPVRRRQRRPGHRPSPPPTTATRTRPCARPAPSGTAATPCTPRTPSPGRCT